MEFCPKHRSGQRQESGRSRRRREEELRRTLGVVPSVSSVGLKGSEVPFIHTSRDDGRKSSGVCWKHASVTFTPCLYLHSLCAKCA